MKIIILLCLTTFLFSDITISNSLKTRAIGESGEKITLNISKYKNKSSSLKLPKRFKSKVIKIWYSNKNNKIYTSNNINLYKFNIIFDFYNYNNISGFNARGGIKTNLCGNKFIPIQSFGNFKKGIVKGEFIVYCNHKQYRDKFYGYITSNNYLHLIIPPLREASKGIEYYNWIITDNNSPKISCNMLLTLPISSKQTNPCKDLDYQDKAMKEYCTNKAYNEQLREENRQLEEKEDKRYEIGLSKGKTDNEQEWNKEEIASYQQEIETFKDQLDRAKARLEAEKDYGAQDKYHNQRLNNLEEEIKRYENNIKNKRSQLEALGGNEISHTIEDNSYVRSDTLKNRSIYKEQQERKARNKELAKAHKIINTFGEDYESRALARKKVEELGKNASLKDAKRIKEAMRKQFFDSSQERSQVEAVYQNAKAKELAKKQKFVETIKDTSLSMNKVLASMDPTGTGEKIVQWQERSYNFIEGAGKDGILGGIKSVAEGELLDDTTSSHISYAQKKFKEYKQYYTTGIKLKPNEIYYDKNHKRLTTVKAYQKIYDKDGNEVSFSYARRLAMDTLGHLDENYNPITQKINTIKEKVDAIKKGDLNSLTEDILELKESHNKRKEKQKSKAEYIGGKIK